MISGCKSYQLVINEVATRRIFTLLPAFSAHHPRVFIILFVFLHLITHTDATRIVNILHGQVVPEVRL